MSREVNLYILDDMGWHGENASKYSQLRCLAMCLWSTTLEESVKS